MKIRHYKSVTDLLKAAAHRWHRLPTVLRHLGGVGLFILAIVDSSPIPTFGGLDIVTAILAARHLEPWYFYAIVATAGSVVGAYLNYRMARKAGMEYLNRKFGERKVARLLIYFERWGTGALVVVTAVPLPFPTGAFFAAAGVLGYPLRNFIVVVALARAARYGAIAAIASHYRRHFIAGLRHMGQHYGLALGLVAAVIITVSIAIVVRNRQRSGRTAANTPSTGH